MIIELLFFIHVIKLMEIQKKHYQEFKIHNENEKG